jgi:hypothetical protein
LNNPASISFLPFRPPGRRFHGPQTIVRSARSAQEALHNDQLEAGVRTHENFSRTHQIKASSNRGFGCVFTAVFVIVGLWPLLFGHPPRTWALIVGAVIAGITMVAPALLATPNRLWLRLGLLLNRIVSPLVLAFIFYVVVTPMGMLMRLLGKDTLRLRSDRNYTSHWVKREPPGPRPDSLRDQF